MKRVVSDDDAPQDGVLVFPFPPDSPLSDKEQTTKTTAENQEEEEDMSVTMLHAECRRRGLVTSGPKVLLLERLRAHRAGEAVLMKKPRLVPSSSVLSSDRGVGHIPLSIGHHKGTETFLALPHDLIKRVLLPHVECADLFSLAMTCKYLHNDCIAEAAARSKDIFDNHRFASPMTLHLLCLLTDMTRRMMRLTGCSIATNQLIDGQFWTDPHRRTRAFTTVGIGNSDTLYADALRNKASVCPRLVRWNMQPCIGGPYTPIEYQAAEWTLHTKNGTENAMSALSFDRAQKEAREKEAELIAGHKKNRASELNKALFGSKVEIRAFEYSDDTKDTRVTPVGLAVLKMFGMTDHRQCRTFINRASPTLPTVVRNMTKDLAFYQEYQKGARNKTVVNSILAYMQLDASSENWARLSVWIPAFFCLDPDAPGALVPNLLMLTPGYIQSLVQWVAQTNTLPTTTSTLCPRDKSYVHAVFLMQNCVENPAVHYQVDLSKPLPIVPEAKHAAPAGYVSTAFWQKAEQFPLGAAIKPRAAQNKSWFGAPMYIDIDHGLPPLISIVRPTLE